MPVLVFLPLECLRLGVWARAETIATCLHALGLMLTTPFGGAYRPFARDREARPALPAQEAFALTPAW